MCDDFTTAMDSVEKCSQAPEIWSCLKKSGAKIVGSALGYRGEIPLIGPYLTVVTNNGLHGQNEGRQAMTSSVYSNFLDFAERGLLRVSLPLKLIAWMVGTASGEQQARGKKDKGAGVMMLGGMMMMTTLASTAFGALALMAAKGLMTSILALMLSAMAVSKKSGGHGHARTTYEVINAPHSGYQQATDYKVESGAIVSEVSSS